MAVEVQALQRAFSYNGVELPDPGTNLTPVQVKELYSATYPELTTADIEGPERKGNRMAYTFHRAVGRKGATQVAYRPRRRPDGLVYLEPVERANCLRRFMRWVLGLWPR